MQQSCDSIDWFSALLCYNKEMAPSWDSWQFQQMEVVVCLVLE